MEIGEKSEVKDRTIHMLLNLVDAYHSEKSSLEERFKQQVRDMVNMPTEEGGRSSTEQNGPQPVLKTAEDFHDRIRFTEANFAGVIEERDKLREQVRKQGAAPDEEEARMRERVMALKADLQSDGADLLEAHEQVKALKAEREKLEDRLIVVLKERDNARKELEKWEVADQRSIDEQEDKEAELERLNRNWNSAWVRAANAESERDQLREKLRDKEKELGATEERRKALAGDALIYCEERDQAIAQRKQVQARAAAAEDRMVMQENHIQELKDVVKNLQDSRDSAVGQRETFRQQAKDAEKGRDAHRRETIRLTDQRDLFAAKHRLASEKNQTLKKQLDALRAKHHRCVVDKEWMAKEIEALRSDREYWENVSSDQQNTINTLRGELEKADLGACDPSKDGERRGVGSERSTEGTV